MISASKKSEVEVDCSKTAYQTGCLQRGTAGACAVPPLLTNSLNLIYMEGI